MSEMRNRISLHLFISLVFLFSGVTGQSAAKLIPFFYIRLLNKIGLSPNLTQLFQLQSPPDFFLFKTLNPEFFTVIKVEKINDQLEFPVFFHTSDRELVKKVVNVQNSDLDAQGVRVTEEFAINHPLMLSPDFRNYFEPGYSNKPSFNSPISIGPNTIRGSYSPNILGMEKVNNVFTNSTLFNSKIANTPVILNDPTRNISYSTQFSDFNTYPNPQISQSENLIKNKELSSQSYFTQWLQSNSVIEDRSKKKSQPIQSIPQDQKTTTVDSQPQIFIQNFNIQIPSSDSSINQPEQKGQANNQLQQNSDLQKMASTKNDQIKDYLPPGHEQGSRGSYPLGASLSPPNTSPTGQTNEANSFPSISQNQNSVSDVQPNQKSTNFQQVSSSSENFQNQNVNSLSNQQNQNLFLPTRTQNQFDNQPQIQNHNTKNVPFDEKASQNNQFNQEKSSIKQPFQTSELNLQKSSENFTNFQSSGSQRNTQTPEIFSSQTPTNNIPPQNQNFQYNQISNNNQIPSQNQPVLQNQMFDQNRFSSQVQFFGNNLQTQMSRNFGQGQAQLQNQFRIPIQNQIPGRNNASSNSNFNKAEQTMNNVPLTQNSFPRMSSNQNSLMTQNNFGPSFPNSSFVTSLSSVPDLLNPVSIFS